MQCIYLQVCAKKNRLCMFTIDLQSPQHIGHVKDSHYAFAKLGEKSPKIHEGRPRHIISFSIARGSLGFGRSQSNHLWLRQW